MKTELGDVARRAQTILERLASEPATRVSGSSLTKGQLEMWGALAEQSSDETRRRLDYLGKLSRSQSNGDPAWVSELEAVIYCGPLVSSLPCDKEDVERTPFFSLIYPIACGAVRLVSQSRHSKTLEDSAFSDLSLDLVGRLSLFMVKPLQIEFQSFKHRYSAPPVLALQCSATILDAFEKAVIDSKYLLLFVRYPVVARLVALTLRSWLASTRALLLRFARDRSALAARFFNRTTVGPVAHIKSGLSDQHNRGHSVTEIVFRNGQRIIYKPKKSSEVLCASRLIKLLSPAFKLPLKIPKFLARREYFWVEYIRARECESDAELNDYYFRCGEWLCFAYITNLTDLHQENIIARKGSPVIVDFETLLHPTMKIEEESQNHGIWSWACTRLQNSVLSTGLLPLFQVERKESLIVDRSGIGGIFNSQRIVHMPQFHAVNSDMQQLRTTKVSLPSFGNDPRKGRPIIKEKLIRQVEQGFIETYRAVRQLATSRQFRKGLVRIAKGSNPRFVFRPTVVYYAVLEDSLAVPCLQDGIARSAILDRLAKPFFESPKNQKFANLFQCEIGALEQLDIPLFYFSQVQDEIPLLAPQETVKERLGLLSDEDERWNVQIIRHAFASTQINPQPTDVDPAIDSSSDLKLPPLGAAKSLYNELWNLRLRHVSGECVWLGLKHISPKFREMRTQILDDGLYEGNCGIALFCSALYAVTGNELFRTSALECLKLPLSNFEAIRAQVAGGASQIAIGLGSGLSSYAYSFRVCGKLLGIGSLKESALGAVELLGKLPISEWMGFDVLSGAAGAILAILSLDREGLNNDHLELAARFGDLLIRNNTLGGSRAASWSTPTQGSLTGFAHGSAGIGYSLIKLFRHTGELRFRLFGEAAFNFERRAFSQAHHNWADFRGSSPSYQSRGWCHGAPGIALSRLGARRFLNDERLLDEIQAGIRNCVLRASESGLDQLCCGNLAHVELLLSVSLESGEHSLGTRCERLLDDVSNLHFRKESTFRSYPNVYGRIQAPGLFLGLAGLGYQVLRYRHPGLLPNILLFD